jgi:hypothetical protein
MLASVLSVAGFTNSGIYITHGPNCKGSFMLRFEIFVLTPAESLCFVWFIALCHGSLSFWCPEIGIGSLDWSQLSRLLTWGRRQSPDSESLF